MGVRTGVVEWTGLGSGVGDGCWGVGSGGVGEGVRTWSRRPLPRRRAL